MVSSPKIMLVLIPFDFDLSVELAKIRKLRLKVDGTKCGDSKGR